MKNKDLDKQSKYIRKVVLDMLAQAGRGHLASAFSITEILLVLYNHILKYRPNNPEWPNRDRFILSKGQGCLSYYAILAEKGFFPKEKLTSFCQAETFLGGHPEHAIPGVEISTGSLGHGLAVGIGMALAAKRDRKCHRVFVLIGDGESNEGSVWEAALYAAKHHLDNLIVLVDYNKMQSWGATKEIVDLEPFADKWLSFGFAVRETDGHDKRQIYSQLKRLPFKKNKPGLLICHTVKGKGIKMTENNPEWHHRRDLSGEIMQNLYQGLEDYR